MCSARLRNLVKSGGIYFSQSCDRGGFTGRIINIIKTKTENVYVADSEVAPTRRREGKQLSPHLLFMFHNRP